MNMYNEWIAQWLLTNRAYGNCARAAQEMAETFPELKVVPGHVECDWGRRSHCWLATKDGSVVDPTVTQFGVVFEYDAWKPGDEIRVGKCMNCGDEIWKAVDSLDGPSQRSCMCSDECARSFEAHLNGEEGS